MFKWVKDLGGTVNAEVKLNKDGVRGLFTTKGIKRDEPICSIPAAAIMNVAGYNDSFAVPTLAVLKEWKLGAQSRFKPYVDMWPGPEGLVNSCNMDLKYVPMWKNDYCESSGRERNHADWHKHAMALLDGSLNPDIEYTVQEVMGADPVTVDDLKYACAISSTRYVSSARRRRLLMAPVFDLANHDRNCANYLSAYDTADFLHLLAGEDMAANTEVCYSYGALRDDYALAHYGFMPPLEDPPRLAYVDHPEFSEGHYSHDNAPSEEPFQGTPEEMRRELQRLKGIRVQIKNTPDALPPQPKGQDYVYDMLKELEWRRLNALEYEIKRLAFALNEKVEL
ncbi:hypothetical protein HYH03_003552 [Edaphochlamys debaryana]|uniref:SET domain-containing protein n=1 Tax=Edaphochlamys debaryana TaxID=47281 RepID=A0A835YCH8_9CHLO|nr:hypothetical protein HYH03_003552 [Edaphochlamys debaryana]|eukprot:KAG2498291.1 hypothetical protein HYH03_003552 [Edaphochlamys debaryana]